MMPDRARWGGPPLALQIMALLVGGLVIAQLVTLVLTLLLPPAPAPQYGLADIAAALSSGEAAGSVKLQRISQAGPPDVSGPGWLVSERSRGELARLMGVAPERVTLAFFTPLPFAGVAAPRTLAMADDGPIAPLKAGYRPIPAAPAMLVLAQYRAPPAAGMRPSGEIGPRGFVPPRRDGFPPGLQGRSGSTLRAGASGAAGDAGAMRGGRPLIVVQPQTGGRGILIPGDDGAALPALLRGQALGGHALAGQTGTGEAGNGQTANGQAPSTGTQAPLGARTGEAETAAETGAGRSALTRGEIVQPLLAPGGPVGNDRIMAPDRALLAPAAPMARDAGGPAPLIVSPGPAIITPLPRTVAPPVLPPSLPALTPASPLPAITVAPPLLPGLATPAAALPHAALPEAVGPPIRIAPARRGLFGLAPAPFVQGDFVAALRGTDGHWSVVRPAPEPFPNVWQRRVLLWFAIAVAVVLPLGWLYARRLVKPLGRFSAAAEQLGRDPAAAIGALDGPAEIGRAARAFNQMQSRLRSFVDDRTAMIGAISHDLRTPLTRMRFRIEDVPDDVREGLLLEVDEMEAMITQVIDFIRDASAPAPREQLDLRALMGEVVEDARLVGATVTIEAMASAPVEVDVLGMRRLLDNLVENAVKYGQRARIRLRTEADSAVAEIIDEGPGVPDDELERVFEPFYRSEAARASDKAGSGLGLAVCRSIARAHGGDIRLARAADGFRAEVRVPLAFGRERSVAFAE